MRIDLIAVIEINNEAGNDLSTLLVPYQKELQFYRIEGITNRDLTKAVRHHTKGFRSGEYDREQACPLFGGYVLRVNQVNKYFPQCCGDLSDIYFWEELSNGVVSYPEGHPSPQIKFKGDSIIFDFTVDKYEEPFNPEPTEISLTIEREALGFAVERVKEKLKEFGHRLCKINETENWEIENIDSLLIWNDRNA